LNLLWVIVVFRTCAHIVCIEHGGGDGNRASTAGINMAESIRERLDAISCEIIFVKEKIIVGWFACAEYARVTVEIVITLDWANNVRVYNRAWDAVIVLVAISIRNWEENHFVVFANDDESNSGIEIKFIACLSDAAELFANNRLEFTFGDAITIDQKALWQRARRFPELFKHVHAHVLHVFDDLLQRVLHPHP